MGVNYTIMNIPKSQFLSVKTEHAFYRHQFLQTVNKVTILDSCLDVSISGVSMCFGRCLLLVAMDPVSCYILYNLEIYSLLGKGELDAANEIY